MPIAASSNGAPSTLDLVLGIAILLWALAGVTALLSWLTRLPRRDRRRTADRGRRHSRFGRLRVGDDAGPSQAEHAGATMTAFEHDTICESDPGPGVGMPTRPAEHHGGAVAAR